MTLRFICHVGGKKGWARPVGYLALATMTLVGLAACGAPAATPTALPRATSTPAPPPSEGADEGNLVYDFAVARIPAGEVVTREGLRTDGKPYILYFFASW